MASSQMHCSINDLIIPSNHCPLIELILDFVYKMPIIQMKSWKKNDIFYLEFTLLF